MKKRNGKLSRTEILAAVCLASLMLTAPVSAVSEQEELRAASPPVKVARIAMHWRGDWKAGVKYYFPGDVVLDGGDSYFCLVKHISVKAPSTDPTQWKLLAASIYWTGDWSVNLQYMPGDGVQHGGSSYLCINKHTSSEATAPPNATYWDLLAAAGTSGATGTTGPQGPTGNRGPDGATGPQGEAGVEGAKGATGDRGPIGETGPDGNKGPDGATGAQGANGERGLIGETGIRGAQGLTGPDGIRGLQGQTGERGLIGETGVRGAQGPTGIGLQGAKGATGSTGAQGITGATGPGIANMTCAAGQVVTGFNGNLPVCSTPPISGYLIFVSSATYQGGLLGGLTGADAACQSLATAAGLPGTYRALLSTSGAGGTTAKNRSDVAAGPYTLVNRTTIVSSTYGGLFDGSINAAINMDETGASHSTGVITAYTGTTDTGGSGGNGTNCSNWTSNISVALTGTITATNSAWITSPSTISCSNPYHLYCFQQPW